MTKRKSVPTNYLDAGPEVDREGATTIIEAVMLTPKGRALTRPDVDQLVIDIRALQGEFLSRKTIDSLLSLSELATSYNKLQRAANRLESALGGVTESWSAHYFFVDAQEEELEREFSVEEAGHAMLDHLVRRAAVALRAVDAARGSDNADRWYELAEGAAPAWLFDYGLPQLFREDLQLSIRLLRRQSVSWPQVRNDVAALGGVAVACVGHVQGSSQEAGERGG